MTNTASRIEVLDVLRGVAIIGTLATNVWLFADPRERLTGPSGVTATMDSLAGAVEFAFHTLANGKFLSLLALLFGIGLELQYRSAQRRDQRWPGPYLWRAALLFLEGALHYVLVFEWDVLMSYAVTSVIVAYLVGRTDRIVRAWIWVTASLHVAVVSLVTLFMLLVLPLFGDGVTGSQPYLFVDRSYLAQVADRLEHALFYRLEAIFIIPMSIALFLLGARLLRGGVFDDSSNGAQLRTRLIVLGFGFALPLNLLAAAAGPAWVLVGRYVLPPVVALGLLGLITTLVMRMTDVPGLIRRGLAAVGRAALSCYVLQNLVASFLCYSWGLGLAERLQQYRPWWVLGAWAGISILMMVLTSLWLRRYTRGPIELASNWIYRAPRSIRLGRRGG